MTESSTYIERLKPARGHMDIVAFLSEDIHHVALHWVNRNDIHYMYCLRPGGPCCAHFGKPSTKYILSTLHYPGGQSENPSSPLVYGTAMPQVKYASLSSRVYHDDLLPVHRVLEEEGKNLTSIDLLVRLVDPHWGRLAFTEIGPARWMQDEAVIKHVREKWEEYNQKLEASIARTISPEQYDELVRNASPTPRTPVN